MNKVPTGTYTIKITFVGYVTDEIQGVVVKNGETTQLNHQLRNDSKTLKDAQVVSTRITNTENAVLAIAQIRTSSNRCIKSANCQNTGPQCIRNHPPTSRSNGNGRPICSNQRIERTLQCSSIK